MPFRAEHLADYRVGDGASAVAARSDGDARWRWVGGVLGASLIWLVQSGLWWMGVSGGIAKKYA